MFEFQLHKAYEKSLLPLERETLFNSLGDPPYSKADVQAKPMLLMMGNKVESDITCEAILGFRSIFHWEDDVHPSLTGGQGVSGHAHCSGDVD